MTDAVTRTTVDPTVIAGIAAIAATQVAGVRLPVVGEPPRAGLGADPEPPVRSWCLEDGSVGVAVTVEVDPAATGGRTLLAVAADVRREVVGALAAMTRLHVSRCDVHVADLLVPTIDATAGSTDGATAEEPAEEPAPGTPAGPVDLAPLAAAEAQVALQEMTFDQLAHEADEADEREQTRVVADPEALLRALPRPRAGEQPRRPEPQA